jgi:hypothetical protein
MKNSVIEIKETVEVSEPIGKVWDFLTDFAGYPDWNPYLRKVTGKFNVNEDIWVQINYPFFLPIVVKPRIVAISPPYSFSWKGRFIVQGWLDGLFLVVLYPVSPETTRIVIKERLEGVFLFSSFATVLEAQMRMSIQKMRDAIIFYFNSTINKNYAKKKVS